MNIKLESILVRTKESNAVLAQNKCDFLPKRMLTTEEEDEESDQIPEEYSDDRNNARNL